MSRPEVSVVIPSFRRQDETIRAVRSVMLQTGIDFEVLVVDDASPEPLEVPTPLLADARMRLIRLAENGGPAAARNAGVEASRGAYIAFLDSDDFFLPHSLAPRLTWLRSQEADRPLLAAAPVWRWVPTLSAQLAVPIGADDAAVFASGCWYFPGSTAIFSRETWNKIGPLDANLRRLEDFEWGLRLARSGGALVISPMPASVVRRSPPAGLAAVTGAARRIASRYEPGAPNGLPPSVYRRLSAYLALELANAAYGEKHYARFGVELIRSFTLRPRRGLHQTDWWRTRAARREELAFIENLATHAGP